MECAGMLWVQGIRAPFARKGNVFSAGILRSYHAGRGGTILLWRAARIAFLAALFLYACDLRNEGGMQYVDDSSRKPHLFLSVQL